MAANERPRRDIFSSYRSLKEPEIGELREPISFYRSKRVPKTGDEGEPTTEFTQEITPYAHAWAKLIQRQGNHLNGQNVANDVSHIFIIRAEDGRQFEQRDYVLFGDLTLSIRGTLNVKDGKRFIAVFADENGKFSEEPRDNTDTPEAAEDEPAPADPGAPLWV